MKIKKIKFTVPGKPMGKERHRTARTKNGHMVSYTPEKTSSYEALVRACYLAAGGTLISDSGQIRMSIYAYFPIPKKTSKDQFAEMLAGYVQPVKRPDADNIAKIICDALNGIAYRDDSQVTELLVTKAYSNQPGVVLQIEAAPADRTNAEAV